MTTIATLARNYALSLETARQASQAKREAIDVFNAADIANTAAREALQATLSAQGYKSHELDRTVVLLLEIAQEQLLPPGRPVTAVPLLPGYDRVIVTDGGAEWSGGTSVRDAMGNFQLEHGHRPRGAKKFYGVPIGTTMQELNGTLRFVYPNVSVPEAILINESGAPL